MQQILRGHTTTLRTDFEGLRQDTSAAIGALKTEMHDKFKKRDDRMDNLRGSMEDIRNDVQNLRLTRPRVTSAATTNEQRDCLPWVPDKVIFGGWDPAAHKEYSLERAQEWLNILGSPDHLAPRTPDRLRAVMRIQLAGPHMAQKAAFQLGLAIDQLNATMPPQTSTVKAAWEPPPSIQAARRTRLTAKHDIAALGIPKEERRADHGEHSIYHGKHELVRVHNNSLVRGHDWDTHRITAGRPLGGGPPLGEVKVPANLAPGVFGAATRTDQNSKRQVHPGSPH